VFFSELDIPTPKHHLGIGGGTHGQNTGRMIEAIEQVLISDRPDWLLVYGDTDSTLAGALAAAKLHIKVAHVEAGLRSFNRRMPEEINRILTDHVSDLLLTPTDTATRNLTQEGIAAGKIAQVGDVMYDAALYYRQRARKPEWFDTLPVQQEQFILCTIHRAENTDNDQRMREILSGLATSPLPVVMPLHPRTRHVIARAGLGIPDNIHLTDPVGYLEMVWLETRCAAIATDSGGVQKEAYFHQKPCITLRNETEWVELVETGWNTLAGASKTNIEKAISRALEFDTKNYRISLYGSGSAGSEIVNLLESNFHAARR
jgi:UDP-GlcNAc3NAcA epimerase